MKQILKLLPPELDHLCSPFVGGASVELACAAQGVEVFAYDAFQPLVNFWQVLLEDAPALARQVKKHHPISKEKFYRLQRHYFRYRNPRNMAAIFFALNRSSFSGTTLSGGMSDGHPRFTERVIQNLANFKVDGFHVEHADFRQSLKKHKNDFLYLDPPYANQGKLYGDRGDYHVEFDHKALAAILRSRGSWLLSYNDCETVRELYKGFRFLSPEWAYGMNTSKKSNEVFVLSSDYPQVP